MQKEFSLLPRNKITNYLVGACMIGVAIFLATSSQANITQYRFSPFIAVAGIFIALQAMRKKVIIDHETITSITTFRHKEIAFDDIEGIQIEPKFISIISNSRHKKDLHIHNYKSLADNDQLVDYLKRTFYKMDDLNRARAQVNLSYDSTYGFTPEQRKAYNEKLIKITDVINGVGIALTIAIFVVPFAIFKAIVIAFPLLCILTVFGTDKRIKMQSKYSAAEYPVIGTAFILPIIALFVKSFIDYDLYNLNNLWMPSLAIATVLSIVCYMANVEELNVKYKYIYVVGTTLTCLSYSFAGVRIINCAFDSSAGVIYKPLIINKGTSQEYAEHTTKTKYDINLTAWGPDTTVSKIEVSAKLYQQVNVGDTLHILVKPGLLNIPWYEVKK